MYSTDDLIYAAATIYGEARGTTQEDREQVMGVIWNRYAFGPNWMKRGNKEVLAGTIAGVCTAPWQFSCWNDNDPNQKLLLDIIDDPSEAMLNSDFLPCLRAAMKVIAAEGSLLPHGILHYHASWMDFPSSWGDPIKPVLQNGHHKFYEGIK